MNTIRIDVDKSKVMGLKMGAKIKVSIMGSVAGLDSYDLGMEVSSKDKKTKETPKGQITIKPSSVEIDGGKGSAKEVFDKGMKEMEKD